MASVATTIPTIAGPDEAALIEAAQGGDRAALDRLLRLHYDRVHAVCRRIAGNDADGADATQEALLAIVKGLPRFDGRAAFGTWAYRVATNACLDELRRRKRRPDPVEELPEPVHHDQPFDARIADRASIDAALAILNHDWRAALVLRDLCGLDYAEIGEVLAIPPGTVRSRISRARTALATALGTAPLEPDVQGLDHA